MNKYEIRMNHPDGSLYSGQEMFVTNISTSQKMSRGTYKGLSAPGSMQGLRILWDSESSRYILPLDFFKKNARGLSELDKKVSSTNLTDDNGSLITSANPYNEKDPFFNHQRLQFELQAGFGTADSDNPIDAFLLEALEADSRVKVFHEGNKKDMRVPKYVKFVITQVSKSEVLVSDEAQVSMEANKIIENAPKERLPLYLRAIGTRMKNSEIDVLEESDLRAMLFSRVILNGSKPGRGRKTILELFMDAHEMEPEELDIKDLIERALKSGIITKGKGNRYTYGGVPMGTSKDGLKSAFLAPSNKELLSNLTRDVNFK